MAKLYYRYGAMNSGKTTALLQVAFNYNERGMRVLILKASVDTKGGDHIVSRLGVSHKVDVLVSPDMDILDIVRADTAAMTKRHCTDPKGSRLKVFASASVPVTPIASEKPSYNSESQTPI